MHRSPTLDAKTARRCNDRAAKNSDSEIARRAQAAIEIITERADERVFREMVGKLHQIELDRFVRRMVTEPKFAGEDRKRKRRGVRRLRFRLVKTAHYVSGS